MCIKLADWKSMTSHGHENIMKIKLIGEGLFSFYPDRKKLGERLQNVD